MKRKFCLVLIVLAAICCMTLAADDALPKAEQPIVLTAFGQSPDANFVNLLAKQLKLDIDYEIAVDPASIDWGSVKTVIGVIGGSGKGLGSAGLDINSEVARCEKIISDAKANGATLIGMHIGGEDRRGVNSQPFLPLAGEMDMLVVKDSGNTDGYFTDLCAANGIPMRTVTSTAEIRTVLQEIFL